MNKGLENVDIYIVKLCKKSYKIEKKTVVGEKKNPLHLQNSC